MPQHREPFGSPVCGPFQEDGGVLIYAEAPATLKAYQERKKLRERQHAALPQGRRNIDGSGKFTISDGPHQGMTVRLYPPWDDSRITLGDSTYSVVSDVLKLVR